MKRNEWKDNVSFLFFVYAMRGNEAGNVRCTCAARTNGPQNAHYPHYTKHAHIHNIICVCIIIMLCQQRRRGMVIIL
jgi:hypothetical protein